MKHSDSNNKTIVVDASGKILGRLATQVADLLRGKKKTTFVPHKIVGDKVVVINACKIQVSGNKTEKKIYYHHTGWPGGLKKQTFKELMRKNPAEVIRRAVRGMLPKNRLRKIWLKNLKIYPNEPEINKQNNKERENKND